MDFVRKAVRAIGRCAIKVEQSAERCVSTLLDLIQTKVCWLYVCVFLVEVGILVLYLRGHSVMVYRMCLDPHVN